MDNEQFDAPGHPITGHDPVHSYALADMLGEAEDGDDCPILWEGCAPTYREELTEAGPQLVIPGCERKPRDTGKPAQLSLFG
jgi:hypothetical protein